MFLSWAKIVHNTCFFKWSFKGRNIIYQILLWVYEPKKCVNLIRTILFLLEFHFGQNFALLHSILSENGYKRLISIWNSSPILLSINEYSTNKFQFCCTNTIKNILQISADGNPHTNKMYMNDISLGINTNFWHWLVANNW